MKLNKKIIPYDLNQVSLGICSLICMYIHANANRVMLQLCSVILKTSFCNIIFEIKQITSFTECKISTTQTLSSGVNATIRFKNITTTSDNNATLVTCILRQMTTMSLLLDVVVFFEFNRSIYFKRAVFGLCHYSVSDIYIYICVCVCVCVCSLKVRHTNPQ